MNQDDNNDPATAKPQISPEPTPQMAKALTLVENKPQAESPPFYTGKRKQKRAPRIVTGGGADEARAYVAATPLPANRDNPAANSTERVHVAAGIDPRRAQTLRSIRMDPLTAGAPAPLAEGNPGGFPEAPPDPADGVPQSSRSRTLGGRTQRIYGGAAPEPAVETHTPHPRQASSGPSRTVGGRTQKLPVMAPGGLAAESTGRHAAGAAAPAVDPRASAEATGRELQRAQATAHAVDQERSRRRRVIVALLLMVLTILVLLVIAMIPRGPREGEQLAEGAASPTQPLPAEAPPTTVAPDPPAPIPTEVAAAVTADPTASAADPPATPEPPIATAEPSAVAPPQKKGRVRPPPRSTSQASAAPIDKPPAQPTTAPSTPPETPPDDFILRPKQP